jgi:hypothetical protein
MNIQLEKLKLIEWLAGVNDQITIEKIKFLKNNPGIKEDWWNVISEPERISIEKGLNDIEQGKTTPHKEIRKKYEKWL